MGYKYLEIVLVWDANNLELVWDANDLELVRDINNLALVWNTFCSNRSDA